MVITYQWAKKNNLRMNWATTYSMYVLYIIYLIPHVWIAVSQELDKDNTDGKLHIRQEERHRNGPAPSVKARVGHICSSWFAGAQPA